jgi:GT2 family glycosyltransferase
MEAQYSSISVIIPVYNSQKTIEKCLSAVIEAPPMKKEIIVVDDASTDRTYEIISGFPVKVFKLNENSGPAAARNFGFEQSTGDAIFFLDSDIIIMRDTLTKLICVLREKSAGAAGGLPRPLSDNLISDSYVVRIFGISPIVETSVREIRSVGGGIVLYPRKVLQEIGGYDESLRMGEDLDLNMRVGEAGYKQFLVPSASGYHDVPSSLSVLARKWFQYGRWFFRVCTKHHLKRDPAQIIGWVISFLVFLFVFLWSMQLSLLLILALVFWLPWLLYYGKSTVTFWIRMKKPKYLAIPLVHQVIILSRTAGFFYAIARDAERKLFRKGMSADAVTIRNRKNGARQI